MVEGARVRYAEAVRTGVRTLAAARKLRREMSPPEVRLWLRLRTPGEGLPRIRRQHPIGRYVLDFYFPAARLCVEVDGQAHGMGDRAQRDARRDAWLAERGIETLRIAASDVMADADTIADGVLQAATARAKPPPSALPTPPPLRRGGE